MAASKDQFFTLQTLRGGQNDTDPASSIADDECVLARNVEFLSSPLGERRLGCDEIDITGTAISGKTHIVFLSPYLPAGTTVDNSYLFAVGATPAASTAVSYRAGVTWHDLTPTDAISAAEPSVYRIHAVSVHGKLFIAYDSSVNRFHVFDGTVLRRTGLAAPTAAPTAANSGGAGGFTGARIYRVRFLIKSGSTILVRSEPSAELSFTPSGVNASVTVTRPAVVDGNETDWELEASDGDGNFYIIATTAIGTTTAVDSTQPATSYSNFILSEDVGAYENIESVKFVIADQDRLIVGGSWEDNTHGSRISWTPPTNATGVGNDERISATTNSFIDLDWQDAGDLTGLSQPVNGVFYAFKYSRIYKIQRTGNADRAYESYLLSTTKGALEGTIFNGVDEAGRPCVYFLDPASGPHRVGAGGVQYMSGIRGTWNTVNTTASKVIGHGVYYPNKLQAHWWVSTDNENSPSYKMISQTSEIESPNGNETRRGWCVADGTISEAFCSTILPEPVIDPVTSNVSLSYRPIIGMAGPAILRCDIGDDDNGDEYSAVILTKPYIVSGLLNKWGAMTASLLATPLADAGITLNVSFIRDFGKETNHVNTDFVPESTETLVNKRMDNLYMSNAYAIQIQFSDPSIVV